MLVDDVQDLLEEQEVGRGNADASADDHGVERPLRELRPDDGLGRLSEIDEQVMSIEALLLEPLLFTLDQGADLRGVHLRDRGEVDELGDEPDEDDARLWFHRPVVSHPYASEEQAGA